MTSYESDVAISPPRKRRQPRQFRHYKAPAVVLDCVVKTNIAIFELHRVTPVRYFRFSGIARFLLLVVKPRSYWHFRHPFFGTPYYSMQLNTTQYKSK
jgi:hypothetical protein